MLGEEKPGDVLSPDNNRVEIKSINEALDFLFEGLLAANRLIVEEREGGRRGVIEALNVVTEFLSFFQGTTHHRQQFTHLLSALLSLEEGGVPPLLKLSAGRSGRRPASPARECDKALAVATVHRLCETGLDPNEARKMVAQVCREAGIKPSRKGAKDSQGQEPEITDRTVRGWDEKITEDVGRHSQAAQTFDRLKQSWTAKTQAITQAGESRGMPAVRNLLDGLRRTLVEMRAPEH